MATPIIAGQGERKGGGVIAMSMDEGVVTILEATLSGYLITDEVVGGDDLDEFGGRWVRGFVYSADLAAQRFFELTGIELDAAEVGA